MKDIKKLVIEMSKENTPKEMAKILVDGIIEGVAESEYGSDDRFQVAFLSELLGYGFDL